MMDNITREELFEQIHKELESEQKTEISEWETIDPEELLVVVHDNAKDAMCLAGMASAARSGYKVQKRTTTKFANTRFGPEKTEEFRVVYDPIKHLKTIVED